MIPRSQKSTVRMPTIHHKNHESVNTVHSLLLYSQSTVYTTNDSFRREGSPFSALCLKKIVRCLIYSENRPILQDLIGSYPKCFSRNYQKRQINQMGNVTQHFFLLDIIQHMASVDGLYNLSMYSVKFQLNV